LGPTRFAEYQIRSDPAYRQTQYFVNGSGLPPETSDQLVAIQRDIMQHASTVKTDETLSIEQRNAQLLILSLQANARLTNVLSAEALDRYRKSAGNWISHVQPAPSQGATR
jgi:hypothetical protein